METVDPSLKALLQEYSVHSNARPYALCIDDEADILELIKATLTDLGFEVLTTTSPEEFIGMVNKFRWQTALIVADLKMPLMDGLSLREAVLKIDPTVPFVILSGYVDRELALRGVDLKISAFLQKPLNHGELLAALDKEIAPRLKSLAEERELITGFISDAKTLLEQAESLALELEERPADLTLINEIFGITHTIKGSSGFFEPKTLHKFAHRFEEVLKRLQSGETTTSHTVISTILKAIDTLRELLIEFESREHAPRDLESMTAAFNFEANSGASQALEEREATKEPTGTPARGHAPRVSEIKVECALLDKFLQASGEVTVVRNMINKAMSSLERTHGADKDVQNISGLLEELNKINSALQGQIADLRKISLKLVLKQVPRILRDVTRALGKEADLTIVGDSIRVDTAIADILNNSLIHLIKNSLDHGLEPPEERLRGGKSRRGMISIHCHVHDENVHISIEDDGRGINAAAIRKKLVSNGSHTAEEAALLSDPEIWHMIFEAGFSTAVEVTDLSGRGVGMSMVKTSVETLGGRIDIESKEGAGAKFTLVMPIPKSVLIKNYLFVRCSGLVFGVPEDQIDKVVLINDSNAKELISSLEGTPTLCSENGIIPLIDLNKLLFMPEKAVARTEFGVIVVRTTDGRRMGLTVDGIGDLEDVVVKPISGCLRDIGLYSGATFLADNTVGLLMNIDGIARKAGAAIEEKTLKRRPPSSRNEPPPPKTEVDWLLIELHTPGLYAINRSEIFRVEEMEMKHTQQLHNTLIAPYRNKTLNILNLGDLLEATEQGNPSPSTPSEERFAVVVFARGNGFVGVRVRKILDIVSTSAPIAPAMSQRHGTKGNLIVQGRTALVLSPLEIIEYAQAG